MPERGMALSISELYLLQLPIRSSRSRLPLSSPSSALGLAVSVSIAAAVHPDRRVRPPASSATCSWSDAHIYRCGLPARGQVGARTVLAANNG